MRANSFAGQVVAVLSRRAPALQPRPGEPSTFPGRLQAVVPVRKPVRTSPRAGNSRTATRKSRAQAADRHATWTGQSNTGARIGTQGSGTEVDSGCPHQEVPSHIQRLHVARTGPAIAAAGATSARRTHQEKGRRTVVAAALVGALAAVISLAFFNRSITSAAPPGSTSTGATAPDQTYGTSPGTPATGLQSPVYLSNELPAWGGALITTGPQSIGKNTYKDGIRFRCGDSDGTVIYDLYGDSSYPDGYSYLDGVVGIPNDAANAAGVTVTITFSQSGSTSTLQPPLSIVLGRPHKLHLDLNGVDTLAISCSAASDTGHGTAETDVALGDPVLTPAP